jgi:MarR family transcriptional regulator, 2-MHQ and catechol-resistance regulon repressor
MRAEQEEYISEHAMLLFPFVKRLLKADNADPALSPFRNQSFPILRVLERIGPLHISEIGKRLFIAKQNMTTIIDRLMTEGLVQRKSDEGDRRVTNIVITEKGTEYLKTSMQALKCIIKRNLSILEDEDVEALQSALQAIQIVSSRIETGGCDARN